MSIIERIILASTNPGDLVVDFFVGSGTTAIAAKNNGRHFICSDSNPDYIKLVRAALYD
jgi:site-specific DNA-methyltransferase (adenine-specific)